MHEQEVGRGVTRLTSVADVEKKVSHILGEPYASYRVAWNKTFDVSNPAPVAPLHLDVELQDFCNQSCIMCPRNEERHDSIPYSLGTKTHSDVDKLKELIKKAAGQGLQSINFGAFSEPMINPKLWELIEFAHDCGLVDSRVITNGLLLHKYVDKVFSSGLVNLFVSLDANTEETYFKIRGKGFRKVLENLNLVITERKRRNVSLPVIRVSFVDMEINQDEKQDFIDTWLGKVDHIDIQSWSDYRIPATAEELATERLFECRNPWQRLAITAQGDILPCCDFNGRTLVLGNTNTMDLQQAWSSDAMAEVRVNLLNGSSKTCETCQRGRGVTLGEQ